MTSLNAKTSTLIPRVLATGLLDGRTVDQNHSAEVPDITIQAPAGDFTQEALEKNARALLIAAGCHSLAAQVRVEWNSRLRTTAGLASYGKSLVTLNPRLIVFGMAEVDRTLRHELAHLVARFRAGRRRIQPHGTEWQQACRDLGLLDEKRCHNLPLPRRRIEAKHVYQCRSCAIEVRRVRPFRRAVACLKCCKTHNNGRYSDKFRLVKIV